MTETGTTSKDATGLKSVPMRLHLADVQASALQDVIVPLSTDGV